MYTKLEILKLIAKANYQVEFVSYVTNGKPDEEMNQVIDALVQLSISKDKTQYLSYQYIIKAKKY